MMLIQESLLCRMSHLQKNMLLVKLYAFCSIYLPFGDKHASTVMKAETTRTQSSVANGKLPPAKDNLCPSKDS